MGAHQEEDPVAGDDVESTVVQDEAQQKRSKERSTSLPRPEVPGYEIERRLGAGSYGEVWLALQKNTGRKVAIKFFSRYKGLDWPLLKREVGKLVEVLSERRVVHLLQVGWDAEPPYYVMEYLPGGSLADRIDGETLPVKETVDVFREVAEALVYLHGKAILHCDLKPANVLLDDRNEIRLADFGQARLSSEEGPAVGTLFYMAPEQALPGARPDVRSDVYSLGALAYTMLTGRPPYSTDEANEDLASSRTTKERIERYRQIIEDSPEPKGHHGADGMDRALIEILDRCLKKDPDQRFENVQQILEALAIREQRATRQPLVVFGLLGPLALLLALAGVGVWAQSEAETEATATLTQQTLDDVAGHAELIAAVVDRNLSAAGRRLTREARSPVLSELMEGGDRGRLQEYARSLYEAYRDRFFHNWVIADANAVVLARAPYDDRVVGSRYAYREWFTGNEDIPPEEAPDVATPRSQPGLTLAFESTAEGNPLLVSVASPIWSEAAPDGTKRVLGVVAATLHLETFNAWLEEAEGARLENGCPTRFAVLMNRGQLVRHPCPGSEASKLPLDRENYFETAEVQSLVDSGVSLDTNFRDPLRERDRYLASFKRFRENGDWAAIVEHDRAEAMSPVTSLMDRFTTLGWVTAATGLFLVVALWALLYRVSREQSILPSKGKLIQLDI